MAKPSQVVLITGATAGIGRSTALYLATLGYHVIATGRKSAELDKVKLEAGSAKLDTVFLDITSPASIDAAVADVDKLTGGYGLDVLVNNAGFAVVGPAAEISDSEMRRQYETNVFGPMNVIRAFLPRMRDRRSGRIINVSSLNGRMSLPCLGVYSSTKYAIESLSDALRLELRAFGIAVVLIEPGIIRTTSMATSLSQIDHYQGSRYQAALDAFVRQYKRYERLMVEPIVVAKAIERAISARRPSARYLAPFSNHLTVALHALLPTRIWDWAMRRIGGLDAKALGLATSARPAAHAPELEPVTRSSAQAASRHR